jgi:hypothetical protein
MSVEPVAVRCPPGEDFALSDCQRALRARKALAADPAIAPHNIGVSVRAGQVTLWGLVPSATVAQRAAELVRPVLGVLEVHNELHIVPPDDPLIEFLAQPPRRLETMPVEPPFSPFPHAPSALTSRPATTMPATGPSGSRTPGLVMPAIPVPPRPGAVTAPAAQLMRPASTAPAGSLAAAVEHLRQGEARYRWVRADVQDGTVRLKGFVPRWEDMYDLARAVSHLPGVQHVVLEAVHTIPTRQ